MPGAHKPYEEVAAHFSAHCELPTRLVPSSNLAACIHMAIDGFGTATVPASMVINELKSGGLRQINYDWTPKSLVFFARYDADRSARFVERAAEIASEVSRGFAKRGLE